MGPIIIFYIFPNTIFCIFPNIRVIIFSIHYTCIDQIVHCI